MLAQSLQQRRIVLVEDDHAIERNVAPALLHSFSDVELCSTQDPAEALRLLDDDRTRLLIADVQASVLDVLALLSAARQRRPNLPMIAIGSEADEALRTQARALGAAAWVDKPPKVERLIGLVERLMLVPAGFSGEFAVDALTELVQLLCAAATSGVLRIDHGEERGSISFERGAIVDAEIGGVHGVPAFQRMLKWTGGVFGLDRQARAKQRSIQVPTMQLLLEAVRLLDEEHASPEKRIRGSEVRLRAVGSSSPPPLPPEARVVRPKSAPPIRAGVPRPPAPTGIAPVLRGGATSDRPEVVRLSVPMPPPEPAGHPTNGHSNGNSGSNGNGRDRALSERWATPEQRAAESFERGMQLAQDKRYDEALGEWETAAALVPDNRTYQFNLRRLRELAERRRDERGLNGDQE